MDYTVGSEQITFSEHAPVELRGKTATRWYVAAPDGRKVVAGLTSEQEALDAAILRAAEDELTDALLADGRTVRITVGMLGRFVGLDAHGHRVLRSEGMTYAVTDCCGASGKGSGGGIVCRACYRPVSYDFAVEATVAVPVA